MKRTPYLAGLVLFLALLVSGCGSLRVIEGSPSPPEWAFDPVTATNYDASAFVYAPGISTYCVVLEDGINDARHDALRKLVERVAVAAEDTYLTERRDKSESKQTGMPNIPQAVMNGGAVDVAQEVDARKSRKPSATHVSQTRLHGVEEAQLIYTVWRYRPGLWSRLFGDDNAVRFYDIYVLLRCPVADFEKALETERKWDANPELTRPAMNVDRK